MMQSGINNSIKNSNFFENKENFEARNSIKLEVETRVENNLFIREVPSLVVPYLFEKPPLENLSEVISDLGDKLTKEKKKNKNKKVKRILSGSSDDSWKMDSSSEEEESESDDDEDEDLKNYKKKLKADSFDEGMDKDFFEKSIGSLLMSIGSSLVQEQCDISLYREIVISKKEKVPKQVVLALNSKKENLKKAKTENKPFKFPMNRCEFCDFKTESKLVMANHYETPHATNRGFRCNYCKLIFGTEYKIKFHMETVHNIKARLQNEKVGTIFECNFCEFDSPLEYMVEEHTAECGKQVNLKRNLAPPADWEPPAKKRKVFSSVVKDEIFVLPKIPSPPKIKKELSPVVKKKVDKPPKFFPKPPPKIAGPDCEICENSTADFDHFRRHMQYLHYCILHKVPLKCGRCVSTFHTDRGYDRHMLGLHGMVTNGMREAANKGKDGGKCPICKKNFPSKLLEHVVQNHMQNFKAVHPGNN